MTVSGPHIPAGSVLSDDDWFQAILTRLDTCLNSGDTLGRLRVIREAKNDRPHLVAWFVGIEFMCPHVDGAVAARKAAMEIAEKAKVTNTVNMKVEGDVTVTDGGVLGVDGSTHKTVEGGNGEAKR